MGLCGGVGSIPSLAQWVKDLTAAAGVVAEVWVQFLVQWVKRSGLATAAVVAAAAWRQSLAWELPYVAGAAIGKKKTKKDDFSVALDSG